MLLRACCTAVGNFTLCELFLNRLGIFEMKKMWPLCLLFLFICYYICMSILLTWVLWGDNQGWGYTAFDINTSFYSSVFKCMGSCTRFSSLLVYLHTSVALVAYLILPLYGLTPGWQMWVSIQSRRGYAEMYIVFTNMIQYTTFENWCKFAIFLVLGQKSHALIAPSSSHLHSCYARGHVATLWDAITSRLNDSVQWGVSICWLALHANLILWSCLEVQVKSCWRHDAVSAQEKNVTLVVQPQLTTWIDSTTRRSLREV